MVCPRYAQCQLLSVYKLLRTKQQKTKPKESSMDMPHKQQRLGYGCIWLHLPLLTHSQHGSVAYNYVKHTVQEFITTTFHYKARKICIGKSTFQVTIKLSCICCILYVYTKKEKEKTTTGWKRIYKQVVT